MTHFGISAAYAGLGPRMIMRGNTLRSNALRGNALRGNVLRGNTLRANALRCTVLRGNTVLCGSLGSQSRALQCALHGSSVSEAMGSNEAI